MKKPKVFISYSHSSEEHKKRIRDFAAMLRSNGIDATLDQWEVKGGKDLNAFMEKAIDDADKVIIACDKVYSVKANERSGGAGVETLIISPDVYGRHDQNKYIPVIFEKDINGNAYTPKYLKGRFHYDFSDENNQDPEDLIRDIFGKPKHTKPPIGSIPQYIKEYDEDDPKAYLNPIAALSRTAIEKINHSSKRSSLHLLTKEIEKIYEDNLITFKEYKDDPSNITYQKIEKFADLLEPFINILEAEIIDDNLEAMDLITMFERLSNYDWMLKKGEKSITRGMWDHINFSIYELFLYTIVVLKAHNKHQIIKELLHANFFTSNRMRDREYSDFLIFNKYLPSLTIRSEKSKLNTVSLQADLIVNRANKTKYKASTIVETDLYLAYYSEIKNSYGVMGFWFPRLYTYYGQFSFEQLFKKLISKRYFNQFLIETGLENRKELTEILEKYENDLKKQESFTRGYSSYAFPVPLLIDVLKTEQLGTIE